MAKLKKCTSFSSKIELPRFSGGFEDLIEFFQYQYRHKVVSLCLAFLRKVGVSSTIRIRFGNFSSNVGRMHVSCARSISPSCKFCDTCSAIKFFRYANQHSDSLLGVTRLMYTVFRIHID